MIDRGSISLDQIEGRNRGKQKTVSCQRTI
jgi:hypothetical protein